MQLTKKKRSKWKRQLWVNGGERPHRQVNKRKGLRLRKLEPEKGPNVNAGIHGKWSLNLQGVEKTL